MKVIFFKVDGVLNYTDSDAVAPSGAKGVAEANVKKLRDVVKETGARLVLYGSWKTHWDFNDEKCDQDGTYLNKKMERRGLHILDKTRDEPDDIQDWLNRHPNVTDYCVLGDMNNIRWVEM